MRSGTRKWLVAGLSLVLAAFAAASLASAAPHSAARPHRYASAHSAAVASPFSVLTRTPAVSSVPAAVEQMAETAQTDWGIDVAQTRQITAADGSAWYLIPGTTGVCFYTNHVGGCNTWQAAAAGQLLATGRHHQTDSKQLGAIARVIGVAPDGVSSVSSGSATTLVPSNVYALDTAKAQTLKFHGSTAPSAVRLAP